MRYLEFLWPWTLLLFVFNLSLFIKKLQVVFFIYVSLSWMLLALVYFLVFFSEVHTQAYLICAACLVQGVLILCLKVIFSSSQLLPSLGITRDRSDIDASLVRKCIVPVGYVAYLFCATLPFSYFVPKTSELVLLFGWGIDQTALGSIALILVFYRKIWDLVLAVIPLVWLAFSAFFL